jgi:hypothetical protein
MGVKDEIAAELEAAHPQALTDAQLAERTESKDVRKVSAARWHLWHDDGRVEPAGETRVNGRKVKLWRAVMEPERYAEVAAAANAVKPRRVSVRDLDTTQQADIVILLLRDAAVAKAVKERQDGLSKRAQQRVRGAVERETQAQVRDRRAAEAQARREGSAVGDFLAAKNRLRDASMAVHAVSAHLSVEVARVANGEVPKIPPAYWTDVVEWVTDMQRDGGDLLAKLVDAKLADAMPCAACGHELGGETLGLDEGYDVDAHAELLDAEVIEVG